MIRNKSKFFSGDDRDCISPQREGVAGSLSWQQPQQQPCGAEDGDRAGRMEERGRGRVQEKEDDEMRSERRKRSWR